MGDSEKYVHNDGRRKDDLITVMCDITSEVLNVDDGDGAAEPGF